MKIVKFSDFEITALQDTVRKINLSDEQYFSKEYSHYISNSRLALINPEQEGSPQKYKDGFTGEITSSLVLGSAVHQLYLQPDEFTLIKGLRKPSAKLGQMIERIKYYRNKKYSIYDAIINSSTDIEYYVNSLTVNRIKKVIKEGLYYYLNSRELEPNSVVLNDADTDKCERCLNSLSSNTKITRTIQGFSLYGTTVNSYNEDALFMDVQIIYKGKSVILPLKMKADNWTIDAEEQKLTLNDLKTTGKAVQYFMGDSFIKYHYARQMAMYSWILSQYCGKHFSWDKTWTFRSNIAVVETVPPFSSQLYNVSREKLKEGMKELRQLLKRVAYHELYGYDKQVEFI